LPMGLAEKGGPKSIEARKKENARSSNGKKECARGLGATRNRRAAEAQLLKGGIDKLMKLKRKIPSCRRAVEKKGSKR